MLYTSTDAPVRASLDTDETDTLNAGRYRDANARLRLNGKGQPVAIRRVVSMRKGSFATRRYQVVKPDGIASLSPSKYRAWENRRSRPVN